MKEYELYIPLNYNDGPPIEPEKLVEVRDRLLQQFGLFTGDARRARRFFRRLKEVLKQELKQEEIFIMEKEANVL